MKKFLNKNLKSYIKILPVGNGIFCTQTKQIFCKDFHLFLCGLLKPASLLWAGAARFRGNVSSSGSCVQHHLSGSSSRPVRVSQWSSPLPGDSNDHHFPRIQLNKHPLLNSSVLPAACLHHH